MRKFDIILFGATGFTGKHVIEEFVKTLNAGQTRKFTWAIAGRHLNGLKNVLNEVSQTTGTSLNHIECIVADVTDYNSLCQMVNQCTVLINTVGPYAFYGENVLRACIEGKTHHVDISAESHNLTQMQLKYNEMAREASVYIVGSCGFDSIPIECGINFLKEQFNGELNSVVSYLYVGNHLWSNKIHYGTWQSVVRLYADIRKLRLLLNTLYKDPLPKPKYKLHRRLFHFNNVGESGSCIPFPSPDTWAVERTTNYNYIHHGQKPIQYFGYLKQSSIILTLGIAIGAIIIGLLIQTRCGLYLVEHFPRLFSLGIVNHVGPNRVQMNRFNFSQTIIGEGWDTSDEEASSKPNKRLVVKVEGVNPAYGATCTCLVQAALTIIEESDKMPSSGGVFTPGTAFANTTIIQRLNAHGVKFNVI